MSSLRSELVPVFTEHFAEEGLSVASFNWPESNIDDIEPYKLILNEFVSIDFDKHTPVRPQTVSIYDAGAETSAEMLGNFVGPELTDALIQTKRLGFSVITISLNAENRFAIAELQQLSPTTPPNIRRLCEAMLDAHNRADTQTNLIPRARGIPSKINKSRDPRRNY